jgi:hypothetical protein
MNKREEVNRKQEEEKIRNKRRVKAYMNKEYERRKN